MQTQSSPDRLRAGTTLTENEIQGILDDFHRDGFRLMPGVFDPGQVRRLKDAVDAYFESPLKRMEANDYADFLGVKLFEGDPVFVDLLTYDPLITLAERVLGANCHLMAENVVRNRPGQAIDMFHVDDQVLFPLPPEIPRHDSRIRMPVFTLTFQILLTDVESLEYGPTEYVPGSHYSGREAPDLRNPKCPPGAGVDAEHIQFEGRGSVPVLCRAGDVYLHNGQCWHRGSPNRSDRTRYMLQVHYAARWVSQRFYPFVNYHMPESVYQNADERTRRILGFHSKGPYG